MCVLIFMQLNMNMHIVFRSRFFVQKKETKYDVRSHHNADYYGCRNLQTQRYYCAAASLLFSLNWRLNAFLGSLERHNKRQKRERNLLIPIRLSAYDETLSRLSLTIYFYFIPGVYREILNHNFVRFWLMHLFKHAVISNCVLILCYWNVYNTHYLAPNAKINSFISLCFFQFNQLWAAMRMMAIRWTETLNTAPARRPNAWERLSNTISWGPWSHILP